MNILSICSEPNILKIIRIIVLLINIIKIAVPIVLIIFLMIKIMGAVSKQNQEEISKTIKSSVPNLIAAVLIFLVPTFINMIVRLSMPNSDYTKCISGATIEKIETAYETKMSNLVATAETTLKYSDYSKALLYLSNIKDEAKKKEYSEKLEVIKEKINELDKEQEPDIPSSQDTPSDGMPYIQDEVTSGKVYVDAGTGSGCNKSGGYNLCAPSRGVFGSFSYKDTNPGSTEDRWSLKMNPAWAKENFVSIQKTCSNGWQLDFQMHRLAKTTWERVLDRLCQITTTGIDGYKYDPSEIKFSGQKASHVARFVSGTKSVSNHSYGITIDINPGVKYEVNGKKYSAYNRDVKAYENFVAALGREDDPRNVNYILWKKIFQPLGFRWGGNWGRNGDKNTYDGMHFEIDWRQTK